MDRPIKQAGPTAGVAMLALTLLFAGSSGCGAAVGGSSDCSVGADCASGACQAGHCVATSGGAGGSGGSAATGGSAGTAGQPSDAGTGGAGGTTSTGGSGGAGGTSSSGGTGGAGGSGGGCATACCPNHDGVIERKEVPLMAGLSAKFEAAEDAPVDTAGTQSGGTRTWDLSGSLPGDHLALVATQSVKGTWYEKNYPGASYASKLSDTQSLLGVFQITNDALLLMGVVSPNSGATRTQLKYSPPVKVLSFPLKVGKTWSSTSNVTGLAQGLAANYTEKYVEKVDAQGTMKTPYADFPVLRVQSVLTRTVGLLTTTVRTYLFTTECFGTIATIVSKDNEKNAEFTTASEVQRLTP